MTVRKAKKNGRVVWRARVRKNGIERTAYRTRRDDAVDAERKLRAEVEAELAGEARPRKAIAFAEHWIEYLRDAASTTNKPSTIASKKAIYKHHLEKVFGTLLLDQIKVRDIDRFKAAKLTTLSPKTVNNLLTVLRNALDVALRWERIDALPRIDWVKTTKPDFRFLDFEQAEALVTAAEREPLAHAMIVTALHTGLRLGELLALQWDAVNFSAGRLHVKRAVARGVIGTPKSGRAREVALSETAKGVLSRFRHLRGPFVFCTEDGRMMTKNEAKAPLRRARVRTKIAELGWHDLRHTFASHLVMRGVSLKAVQELLGHATIEMTMRYAHLSPIVTRDAVQVLDRGGRIWGLK